MPFYAEECASMLAVTFSGGDKMLRSIVSASWAPTRDPCPTGLLSGSVTFVSLLPCPALGLVFPSRSVSLRGYHRWRNGAEDCK